MVEVKERALGALEEHVVASPEGTIDEERRVRDEGCEPLGEGELRRDHVVEVEGLELVHPLQPDVLLGDREL